MKNTTKKSFVVSAPISGKIIALEDVPDKIFSEKVLGDGIAIVPDDGKIYSPVDGVISSVTESKHAYCFHSDDGIDVLVHFGIDTVNLKGQGFSSYVNEGDRVKKGDLVAEVDMSLMKEKNINTVTPVLICDAEDDLELKFATGKAETRKTAIIKISFDKDNMKDSEKKKVKVNFDFLQKLGKVLMVVIAVMPAAGLMISIGKLIAMIAGDAGFVLTAAAVIENIGWAIINNLHILFAVAIGGSWAKERAGGAFAAVIAFILINAITGQIFGVTSEMLNDPTAVTKTLFGQEILVNGYFVSVLGVPALNMGVFVGIISGFVGGIVYNKYYNFRKLPDVLSFFNGKRFVPMAVIFYSLIISDAAEKVV